MKKSRRWRLKPFVKAIVMLLISISLTTVAMQDAARGNSMNSPAATVSVSMPDCPQSIKCVMEPTAFVNATARGEGTCNYTPVGPPGTPRPVVGVVEHTTEGSLKSALAESQDAVNCVSWNYLVAANGTVYQSVPLNGVAYDAANRYYNTGYIQVEHIGEAGLCNITPKEYAASEALDRYLINRFSIQASPTTITGHDSVPGSTAGVQAIQHWDPGICWNWDAFYKALGIGITGSSDYQVGSVITVDPAYGSDVQPVSGCTEGSDCDPSKVMGTNFLALYSQPSSSAPLLSDPYVHSDGSAGSDAMNDWGDKAPYGHSYVVAKRQSGFTGIWYGGQIGWFQDAANIVVSIPTTVVEPKAGASSVTLYGRPLPEKAAFKASTIPTKVWQAQYLSAAFPLYIFTAGQSYPMAPVTATDVFYEGCDKTDCSAAGDGAVVSGTTKYYEVSFNHRYAFVKASDVTLSNN